MSNVISIWSDGSSHNKGEYKGVGGWGAVLIFGKLPESKEEQHSKYGDDEKIKEFYGYEVYESSNQRMEIKSVIEALKSLKTNKYPIEVFSDSAYLVNCMNDKWYAKWLTNGWKTSKKEPVENQDLWEDLLNTINDGFFSVNFNKVKSHIGIWYNERADVLAKKGLAEAEKIREIDKLGVDG